MLLHHLVGRQWRRKLEAPFPEEVAQILHWFGDQRPSSAPTPCTISAQLGSGTGEQPQHSHDTFKLKPEAMLEIQRRGHTRYWLSWHLSQLQSEAVSDDCSGPMMVFMPGERVEPLTCLLYARCSAI